MADQSQSRRIDLYPTDEIDREGLGGDAGYYYNLASFQVILSHGHLFSLESITFYLLHLFIMREYLDLEFRNIEHTLPFDYNLESVIDDFILLAVFVGNDFLPDLHIQENGLERLFDVYKALPSPGQSSPPGSRKVS